MWPEGTLRIGAVVGHRCISVVLATMSTLVVGVKVVAPLVIVKIGSSNLCYTRVTHEPFFLSIYFQRIEGIGQLIRCRLTVTFRYRTRNQIRR